MTEDVSKLLEGDISLITSLCCELLRRDEEVAMIYHLRLRDLITTGTLMVGAFDKARETHKPPL